MRYLCQVWLEERDMQALTREEQARLDAESAAYDRELQASGHLVAAEALHTPDTAVTVSARGGRVTVTDGPFAETKEHLGGFLLIEARDLNEAIRLASAVPIARYGRIEVRPTWNVQGPKPEKPARGGEAAP